VRKETGTSEKEREAVQREGLGGRLRDQSLLVQRDTWL